jgi:Nif-specific regulatory protein
MVGYLVIREGSKWTDVFRLNPGESVTIGRAPTNQIVIKDERCSRNHAEIFYSHGRWTLRDLDSRNGTLIGGKRVVADYALQPGDIVRIGNSYLKFEHDLSKAFEDSGDILEKDRQVEADSAAADHTDSASVIESAEPTEITHRKVQSRFLEPVQDDGEALGIPKVGQAATKLCRLAFELAKSTDEVTLAKLALSGLFDSTSVDAGALLMLDDPNADPTTTNLRVVACRTDTNHPYQQLSEFLASTVLREGQAVLARNVMGDSKIAVRDSQGELHTTSVICAPVRSSERVLGVIHLYSTDVNGTLEPEDLEFTLAVADTMAVALDNLSRQKQLTENLIQTMEENLQLRERLGFESEIIGRSPLIERVVDDIRQAAGSRATVLIRGESGVGKELVARAVHFSGPRRKGPFVCLNCAALSESLLESELFGHEKGAFTGATERKVGKFEAADQGTLMLDEIGEMSPTIQAKFLRVLEGHSFERVGGREAIQVDVRVIAATNRNLEKDVADGRFRRDLYFRLHVLEIVVPALRKRIEDIPVLAEYFLDRFRAETGRKVKAFTPRAMDEMLRYRWPGNVRELKNVIERAVVLARGETIDYDDLALSALTTAGDTAEMTTPPVHGFQPKTLADMEAQHILATLNATGWNKSQTAQLLSIERSTLDRKIRRYALARRD